MSSSNFTSICAYLLVVVVVAGCGGRVLTSSTNAGGAGGTNDQVSSTTGGTTSGTTTGGTTTGGTTTGGTTTGGTTTGAAGDMQNNPGIPIAKCMADIDCGGGTPFCNAASNTCVPPSCNSLDATCGPNRNEDCCASNLVTGGTYNRGNDPNYPATVSDFRLDNYEITVGRYRKFVAAYSQTMTPAGAGKNSHDGSDPGWDIAWNDSLPATAAGLTRASCGVFGTFTVNPSVNENRPMNCINWYEAYAFCIWDGGRLPTEAEWNYAAAGGSAQREYPWGATVPDANANLAVYGCHYASVNDGCTGPHNIAPVGSVSAGNGKWGQSDLAGNLWEWAEDWYTSPYVDPCNDCSNSTTATHRVVRSGSYSNDASSLPSWFRNHLSPASSNVYYGARCARNAQ